MKKFQIVVTELIMSYPYILDIILVVSSSFERSDLFFALVYWWNLEVRNVSISIIAFHFENYDISLKLQGFLQKKDTTLTVDNCFRFRETKFYFKSFEKRRFYIFCVHCLGGFVKHIASKVTIKMLAYF